MKKHFKSKLLAAVLAAVMIFGSVPAMAAGPQIDPDLSVSTDTENINPDWIEYQNMDPEEQAKYIEPGRYLTELPTKNEMKRSISSTLPEKYDLRSVEGKNYVSPVRNQGRYDLCWAFAYYGMLESYFLKKGYSTKYNFSERHLDYTTASAFNKVNPYPYKRAKGGGGNSYFAVQYLMNMLGPVSESTMPYYGSYGSMTSAKLKSMKKSGVQLNSTDTITTSYDYAEDENNLAFLIEQTKRQILEHGACATSMYSVGSRYKCTDEVEHRDCYYQVKPNPSEEEKKANHAVLIVGWWDGAPKEFFNLDRAPGNITTKNDGG